MPNSAVLIVLFAALGFPLSTSAQKNATLCKDCDCLWDKAENARLEKRFPDAIKLYNAFIVCRPEGKSKATKSTMEIYDTINALKNLAISARDEAIRQRKIAVHARVAAEEANIFNQNISATLLMADKDPTLALSMAEYLYRQHQDQPAAGAVLNQIARDESEGFYFSLLEGHRRAVKCVAFFPDNHQFATGSSDSTLRIWDTDGRLLNTRNFSDKIVALSVSGEKIIALAFDKDTAGVLLTDATGVPIRRLPSNGKNLSKVVFSPDKRLVAGCAKLSNSIHLWEVTGTALPLIRLAPDKKLVDLTFAPDEGVLYAAASSQESNDIIYKITQDGHVLDSMIYSECNALALSNDGKKLVSGGDDNDAVVWDTKNQSPLLLLEAHKGNVTDVGITSGGTEWYATASQDGSLIIWDERGKIYRRLHGHDRQVNALAFSPDGAWLVSAGEDGAVRLWRMYHSAPYKFNFTEGVGIIGANFFPEKKSFYTAWSNGIIGIWNVNGTLVRQITAENKELQTVSLSPSGKWLAGGVSYGKVMVWDTLGEIALVLPEHRSPIVGLAFTADEKNIVTAEEDGWVRWWNWDGKAVRKFQPDTTGADGFALSPDGRYFAVFTNCQFPTAGMVTIYNAAGRLVRRDSHTNLTFMSISFTADSKNLYLGALMGELIRYPLRTLKPVVIEAADYAVFTLTPVPELNWILTGGGDQRLCIRDQSGTIIQEFLENGGWIKAAAASSDGQFIVCVNQFGQTLIRDLWAATRWAKKFDNAELFSRGRLISPPTRKVHE